MAQEERITDPSRVQTFNNTIQLSILHIESPQQSSESAKPTRNATIVLLQPLASPKMLEACRDSSSRSVYRNDGLFCGTSNNEYLNIKPLSTAWRKALTEVPPFTQLTFDFTLPKGVEVENGSFEKVYWDVSIPSEGGIGIHVQEAMNLAITIATAMKIRTDDEVHFEVTYDEADEKPLRGMELLKKQLRALSSSAVSQEQGVEQK